MTSDLKDTYIVIQSWMIDRLGLKGNSLLLYALIYGFSQTKKQVCSCGIEYMRAWTNSSKQGVLNALSQLTEAKLIEAEKDVNSDGRVTAYRAIGQQSVPIVAAKQGQQSVPKAPKKKVHKVVNKVHKVDKLGTLSCRASDNNNIYNNKYTDLSVSHGAHARGDGTDGLTDEMQFYIDCMREKMSLADEETQGYEVKFFNICNELCHNGTAKINGREIGAAEILKEYLCLFIDDKLAKAFTKIARAADVKNKYNYTLSTLYNAARET